MGFFGRGRERELERQLERQGVLKDRLSDELRAAWRVAESWEKACRQQPAFINDTLIELLDLTKRALEPPPEPEEPTIEETAEAYIKNYLNGGAQDHDRAEIALGVVSPNGNRYNHITGSTFTTSGKAPSISL